MAQARGPDQVCEIRLLALTSSTKQPFLQAKQAKRMRTLRNSVRDLVKPIGPKVTAYGKRIPKERSKVVASLSDLSRFEQVSCSRTRLLAAAWLTLATAVRREPPHKLCHRLDRLSTERHRRSRGCIPSPNSKVGDSV